MEVALEIAVGWLLLNVLLLGSWLALHSIKGLVRRLSLGDRQSLQAFDSRGEANVNVNGISKMYLHSRY